MLTKTILRGLMSSLLLGGLSTAAATCNTPSNRACWTNNFNINTDYEKSVPVTGVTRTYTLTVTEQDTYIAGDGQVKEGAMLINGAFPGPVITADWGDTLQITVINKLRTNGTSFHWHGIRQLNSSIQDGANGVTECPIPPNAQKTYTFLCEQYGTSWYHSHFSTQYANGVVGSIVINGPTSLPYDIDLGAFPITDWYLGSADHLEAKINNPAGFGAPPPSDNVLFNGTNINPVGPGGNYYNVTLTPNKRHLLRIINPSVENTFTVSLVGHDFTVVETDFVPVNAFTTNNLFLGIGQRFTVTIDASQAVGNYWFNVTFSNTGGCGTSVNPHPAAVFRYSGAPNTLPNNTGVAPPDSLCADNINFTPVVSRTSPITNLVPEDDLEVSFTIDNAASAVFWKVNNSAIQVAWNHPTLQYIRDGDLTTFPSNLNLIQLPKSNVWSIWVIQNTSPIPHPMHLHGHDFLILGKSTPLASPFTGAPRPFNATSDSKNLNLNNPTRRDVTMLPAFGWLVISFLTDNPGAWLMHCHIAWHVAQGLSVQFLERASQIGTSMDLTAITPNCNAWDTYYATDTTPQDDSGLKMVRKVRAWEA